MNKKNLLMNYLLGCTMILYFVYLFSQSNSLSVMENSTFLLSFITILFGIVKAKKDISLYKVYLYFVMFFLIIAPITQVDTGYAPWGETLSKNETIMANIIIILFNVSFIFAYKLKYNNYKNKFTNSKMMTEIPNTNNLFYILFSISTVSSIIGVLIIGIENLFVRGEASVTGSPFSIMIDFLIRSIPAISLSIFLYSRKSKVDNTSNIFFNIMIFGLLIYTIVFNWPTSLSRFLVGTVYLGILVSWLPEKFWKNKKFDSLIFLVIVIIFPLFYLFKNYTLIDLIEGDIYWRIGNFNAVDFDAHLIVGRIIRYTRDNGFQFGSQIRSSILFFVPRDLLDIKGIPSGELVATSQSFYFTNVSAPIMGEAYLDFGIFGVFSYGIILGVLLAKIDAAMEVVSQVKGKIFFVQPLFVFMLGFLIFISRGALQPSFLRFMGFYLFLSTLYLLVIIKIKKRLIN